MKWSPEKKVTTTFAVIGGLILFSVGATFGYATLRNNIAALQERATAMESRQERIESKMSELRDLSIEQKTILSNVFKLADYSADGRKGPKPDVAKP